MLLKSKFALVPEVIVSTSSGRKKSVTFSLSKNANTFVLGRIFPTTTLTGLERMNGIILIPTILSPILCESTED